MDGSFVVFTLTIGDDLFFSGKYEQNRTINSLPLRRRRSHVLAESVFGVVRGDCLGVDSSWVWESTKGLGRRKRLIDSTIFLTMPFSLGYGSPSNPKHSSDLQTPQETCFGPSRAPLRRPPGEFRAKASIFSLNLVNQSIVARPLCPRPSNYT
jgi:hypothetical protein